jgi:hypothetical protein
VARHLTDHTQPVRGARVTVDPLVGGIATWIDPATGQVLGTKRVATGPQTLTVPPFTIDAALKISPAGGPR